MDLDFRVGCEHAAGQIVQLLDHVVSGPHAGGRFNRSAQRSASNTIRGDNRLKIRNEACTFVSGSPYLSLFSADMERTPPTAGWDGLFCRLHDRIAGIIEDSLLPVFKKTTTALPSGGADSFSFGDNKAAFSILSGTAGAGRQSQQRSATMDRLTGVHQSLRTLEPCRLAQSQSYERDNALTSLNQWLHEIEEDMDARGARNQRASATCSPGCKCEQCSSGQQQKVCSLSASLCTGMQRRPRPSLTKNSHVFPHWDIDEGLNLTFDPPPPNLQAFRPRPEPPQSDTTPRSPAHSPYESRSLCSNTRSPANAQRKHSSYTRFLEPDAGDPRRPPDRASIGSAKLCSRSTGSSPNNCISADDHSGSELLELSTTATAAPGYQSGGTYHSGGSSSFQQTSPVAMTPSPMPPALSNRYQFTDDPASWNKAVASRTPSTSAFRIQTSSSAQLGLSLDDDLTLNPAGICGDVPREDAESYNSSARGNSPMHGASIYQSISELATVSAPLFTKPPIWVMPPDEPSPSMSQQPHTLSATSLTIDDTDGMGGWPYYPRQSSHEQSRRQSTATSESRHRQTPTPNINKQSSNDRSSFTASGVLLSSGDSGSHHLLRASESNAGTIAASGSGEKVWEDDLNRMVFISWVPRQVRASNIASKRRAELALKRLLRTEMGVKGLSKVLLFPPKGTHCKLVFDSTSDAADFVALYGGDFKSPASELWKTTICQCCKIQASAKFDSTSVVVEWAQRNPAGGSGASKQQPPHRRRQQELGPS